MEEKNIERIREIIKEASDNRYTDKSSCHSYDLAYPGLFLDYLNRDDLTIFEIGTGFGGGLWILSKVFPKAKIFGLDHDYTGPFCLAPTCLPEGRSTSQVLSFNDTNVKFLPPLDQTDSKILDLIPDCDIIIEDCSHIYSKSMKTFELLEPKIKRGGIYIIEDIYPNYKNLYDNDPRFEVVDLTAVKGRGDDVLAIYKKNL